MSFREIFTRLGCEFQGEPASEEQIQNVEKKIGVRFPEDYRKFLLEIAPPYGNLYVPENEPTPFGDPSVRGFYSIDDLDDLLDSNITPRNMITIANSDFMKYICLSVAGIDKGAVYALDGELRDFMDDDAFYLRYPNLADSIQRYLRLRAANELPEKHLTYQHVYYVANSFQEFVEALRSGDLPAVSRTV